MLAGRLPAALDRPDASIAQQLDLLVLAVALGAFLIAGWPMLGYAVAAGVWLVQKVVGILADRRGAAALQRGDRRAALGIRAGTGLGRVWLIALAVLITGLIDRDAGLAAALLSAVLFTIYLGTRVLGHLTQAGEVAR